MTMHQPPDPDMNTLELALGLQPDFGDPDTEQTYARMYEELHDALLDLERGRSVAQEQRLAYLRALLTQRGLDESRLPWEISASYNLRLSEYMEKSVKRP